MGQDFGDNDNDDSSDGNDFIFVWLQFGYFGWQGESISKFSIWYDNSRPMFHGHFKIYDAPVLDNFDTHIRFSWTILMLFNIVFQYD